MLKLEPCLPEYPHDPDQPDDLPGLSNDLDVLQLVQEDAQVKRDDGQDVD